MIVILFGVAGAGKTTLGQMLATDLGWPFYDADDFHSVANKEKMNAGVLLTDEDRQPWLEALRALIEKCLATGEASVLACSALKQVYRTHLRVESRVKFVYLRGSYELVASRVQARSGHFMNPVLLRSQFATLEEPKPNEDVITIHLDRRPPELVDEIKRVLFLAEGGA